MASSRPVVSYDDITLPYDSPEKQRAQPPSKKRKRNANNVQRKVHWDDPAAASTTTTASRRGGNGNDDDDDDEGESRELAHEEIWDDSALIDAWDAAMEEYEAMNGPNKSWKKEPVHKSPLWYNIPPKNSKSKKPVVAESSNTLDTDSQPIDFETFVPTHDPSLALDGGAEDTENAQYSAAGYAVPLTHAPNVTQDEAFERAVQASYWSGYWTAVYHYQRQNGKYNEGAVKQEQNEEEEEEDGEVEEGEAMEEDEDYGEEFVSTQR